MNNQKAFVGWVPHLYPRGGNESVATRQRG